MEEEIEQIEKNKTWTLVPRPEDKNLIGTKLVYKNKLDENGEIRRNYRNSNHLYTIMKVCMLMKIL